MTATSTGSPEDGVAALSDDFYSRFAQIRTRCPVGRAEDIGQLSGEAFSGGYTGGVSRPAYYVTTWADVDAVLRDAETFSSTINAEGFGQLVGETILAMDGQEHRTYRGLVAPAFRASQLEKWGESLILPTITRLLDGVAPKGQCELVAEVTSKYPMQVICGILGVPVHDVDEFTEWAEEMSLGGLERGKPASAKMRAYLEPIVAARRADPIGDLVSELVHTEIDGQVLTEGKLYGFLLQLLPAGAETTYYVMGTILAVLLAAPGLKERVCADRSLLPVLIEETLRWETSITQVVRVVTRDTTLGGCAIPAGASLSVFTSSANHDDNRFPDPELFDLDRPVQHHVAFGTGQHQCLGMHLARLELQVGVNAILDRLPSLRLDPDHPEPAITGATFRGPSALHVRYDAT
jgi:cytochrome P450